MSNELNLSDEGTSVESKELKGDKNFNQSCDQNFARFKFLVYSEIGTKSYQQENHLKRLKNLRKELNYIKATEWMYEPIEKRIGQL